MKMVTYYNTKDMVSFGNYLLSAERRELYAGHPEADKMPPLEDRLSMVNHADVANWKEVLGSDKRKAKTSEGENLNNAISHKKKPQRVTVKDLIKEGMVLLPANEKALAKELDEFYNEEANAKYERDYPDEIKRTDEMVKSLIEKYHRIKN